METRKAVLLGVVLVLFLFLTVPLVRTVINRVDYNVQKADDASNYKTLKNVEDSCRAMMANYEADRLTYEQYKDSDNEEKRTWAEEAKMRANRTAATYNEYFRKNSFVWQDAIPNDIDEKLPYID